MAHGGTNFGFWSGANGDQASVYKPDITSYDYGAPISEAGDHNIGSDGGDLFEAVRSAIVPNRSGFLTDRKFAEEEPKYLSKKAYGTIRLGESAPLFHNIAVLSSCAWSLYLMTSNDTLPSFEDLQLPYGFVLYRSVGEFDATNFTVTAEAAHDRVQVFVDGAEAGTAWRPQSPPTSPCRLATRWTSWWRTLAASTMATACTTIKASWRRLLCMASGPCSACL